MRCKCAVYPLSKADYKRVIVSEGVGIAYHEIEVYLKELQPAESSRDHDLTAGHVDGENPNGLLLILA